MKTGKFIKTIGMIGISILFCFICACGGGENGEEGNGGGLVDTIPPQVSVTAPADSETDIPLNSSITATFNEDMDSTTITTSSFVLNNSVTGTVSYNNGTKTASFTPTSPLSSSTTYTATLTTDISDIAHNTLASTYTWSFTTGTISDTTNPTVLSTTPADGSTDISVSSTISATFSEAMNVASLTSSSFTVEGDGGITANGTFYYDATTDTITLTPSASLVGGITYTVAITTDAEDLSGNALSASVVWSFITASTSTAWEQVGGQVSPGGPESEDPTMLIIGSTPAVGYRHESFRSYLNLFDGTSWGSPEPDPSNNNTNSSIYGTPSFCSAGSIVYMAYSSAGDGSASDNDAFYDRIFVYAWTQGAGWICQNSGNEVSIPYNTATSEGANAWEPALACLGSGNPFVAWVETDVTPSPDGDDDLWLAEVTSSLSTRSSPLSRNSDSLATYSTDVRTVGITVSSTGTVYVAQWEQHPDDQDRTDLYVSQYSGGVFTSLGSAISDDYDSNNLSLPSLAVMGTNLFIAYSRANSLDYTKHVYVKQYDGSTWTIVGGGPVSAFSSTDHYDSANPDLLVIKDTLYIAWEESDQYDGYFIYVAYFDTLNEQWIIDGEKLNMELDNSSHDPSLAYSSTDQYLYVAFEEFTDGHPHIFVKRKALRE
ncbi:MAG: Ig-like domain-containing protein [bacterium]